MSVGRLLDISVRTMQTYQQAIDVASHNISNAGSPDYTRQRIVLASDVAENGIGSGVKVQDVQRIRNQLNDAQIRKYQSQYSDSSTKSDYLSQIETVISEPSTNGLSSYFSNFFNSWDQLTTNPNSIQARLNIIQSAQQLSSRFQDTFDGLNSVQNTVAGEAQVKVDQINSYTKEICSLNQKIYEIEVRGERANDLKDERDKMIDSLSQLVNISVQTNEFGTPVVSVGGAQGADLNSYSEFKLVNVNGKMKLTFKNDENVQAVVNGGELSALMDLYSNKIPSYLAKYEDLAKAFANKINIVHKTGFTLMQNGVSSTNINFFGKYDDAGNLVVFDNGSLIINQAILDNPQNIAASDSAGNDGNGNNANKLARLGDTKISELGNQTFFENYNSVLSEIGTEKVTNDNKIESSKLVLQQLQNQKGSESGVSLDEEMTNVLKYQRAYDAAAKLIKVADELMQTILQMV